VDFGASDAPLTAEELDAAGLIQFPMVIGGVVPVVNVPGLAPGDLKLTPDAVAAIFLGDIDKWNDPGIVQANEGLALPDRPITVVHRADGSGTTWIFTSYLASISTAWADRVGTGKSVNWPVGVAGPEGVANYVGQVDGSIGYVEYAYALQNDMTYCRLGNSAENFVEPTADAFMAAASNADWTNAPGYYVVLVDQPGENTWPIVGASFILVYKEQSDARKARAMLEFFDWCYRDGRDDALELDYVPIPDNVVEMVETTWADELTVNGEKVWD
jgi:phosphate transport system substrate-binding protein